MPQPTTPVLPGYDNEVKFAEHQPEFNMLPALCSPTGNVMSRWKFTDAEREAIAAGADLLLVVSIGHCHECQVKSLLQPVLLTVPGCDRDALILANSLDII